MTPTRSFRETRAQSLRKRMQLGTWYDQAILTDWGGSRFAARLAEIARNADGLGALTYDVDYVNTETGECRYRLRRYLEGEKHPEPRRSRVKQLEAELEGLREELRWFRAQVVGR